MKKIYATYVNMPIFSLKLMKKIQINFKETIPSVQNATQEKNYNTQRYFKKMETRQLKL